MVKEIQAFGKGGKMKYLLCFVCIFCFCVNAQNSFKGKLPDSVSPTYTIVICNKDTGRVNYET